MFSFDGDVCQNVLANALTWCCTDRLTLFAVVTSVCWCLQLHYLELEDKHLKSVGGHQSCLCLTAVSVL